MKRVAFGVAGVLLAACTAAPTPPSTQPLPLPTDPRWIVGSDCLGTGTDAVIHGSPADPRLTWVTSSEGTRTEIVWPVGYTARFVPALEVLDQDGKVVAREGDHLTGWCRTTDTPVGKPMAVQGADVAPAPSPT